MKDKFSCDNNYNCIIPPGLSNREIEERQLPHCCLECEHYTMETKNGEIIKYCNWEGRNDRQREN